MKCGPGSAVERIEQLIARQSAEWPLLARGLEGLRESRTRSVRIRWFEVMIRHIPHRIGSTTAKVDPESVQKRPCFLCRENLPPEEQGVPLDSQFTAYCNPFPILNRHLTIVHNDHRPQAIAGQVEPMLRLAESLPGYFLIYNGPECGASAPDHLHFQACSRDIFPIEKDAENLRGPSIPDYGRRVFVLRDQDFHMLSERLENLISMLVEVTGKKPEPLINIAVFHDAARWTAFVFPRAKHRPRVYETGELTVSPATIDLSGVFVVPKAADFDRIRGEDIEAIFEEVTLHSDVFDSVLRRLKESK